MTGHKLPNGWEELDDGRSITEDTHGKFANAWGHRGSDGHYEKIVALNLYNGEVDKRYGRVYTIRNPPRGPELVNDIMETLARDAPSFGPILSTHAEEGHGEVEIDDMKLVVDSVDDAVERAIDEMV